MVKVDDRVIVHRGTWFRPYEGVVEMVVDDRITVKLKDGSFVVVDVERVEPAEPSPAQG
jgi:hypothetical protein